MKTVVYRCHNLEYCDYERSTTEREYELDCPICGAVLEKEQDDD